MSKITFNKKEIKSLAKNKYVKKVSSKSITYSIEFKEKFIEEYYKGKLPRVIFEECGFDIDLIGLKRVEQSACRWKKSYEKDGLLGLQDIRKSSLGRPQKRDLTVEEKNKKLEAKVKLLEVQVEFLKKLKKMKRGW